MSISRRTILQAAGMGVGLGATAAGWAFHNDGLALVQPSYGDIKGIDILGYSDLRLPRAAREAGWDQVYDFRVIDTPNGRFAYCPNGAKGWSIVDVSNPRRMHVVNRHPHSTTPDNTQYLDIKTGAVLVIKRNKSLENWDVRNPAAPVLLGAYSPPDIGSRSFHGLWVHEDHRGRFAFAACGIDGFTDMILLCVDITDPRHPRERGRWWYPGMKIGSETPTWPAVGITVQCHDLTTYGDRAYVAWRDKGLIILDISNLDQLRKVGEINWADGLPRNGIAFPSLPGQTHSFGIVVPKHRGRVETVVATDELGQCPFGFMHFIDVRNEARPTEISQFRLPLNMHGNCPADRPGGRMGIHDVERMIRGKIVWSAWEEGGFWGVDFSDIHYPKQVAYYVPPVRSDSTRLSGHADDVFVMDDGIVFGSSSDIGAGGLWAMRYDKGERGTVAWNNDESGVVVTRAHPGHGRDEED